MTDQATLQLPRLGGPGGELTLRHCDRPMVWQGSAGFSPAPGFAQITGLYACAQPKCATTVHITVQERP